MGKKSVTIEMSKGPSTLSLNGELYNAPIRAKDAPIRPAELVRRTASASYRLDPGNYSWRFDVSVGSGNYTLEAFQADVKGPIASEPFNTNDGRTLIQFKFTVV